jgi:integrase
VLRKVWPHDVLRHTFATMHYAHYQNRSLLQALMGHSGSENTLFQHYRAVLTVSGETVTARMANAFWALMPTQ